MPTFYLILCCVLSLFPCLSLSQPPNLRPIVGILSQPQGNTHNQFIVAAYVKWIESAGARVVPIFYNQTQSDLETLFNSINGVVFTGGSQTLAKGHTFYDAGKFLYNLAVNANEKGDYFPLWGTCQGFQLLHIAASGIDNETVLDRCDAFDIVLPLTFEEPALASRLFRDAPLDTIVALGTENITVNLHHYSINPKAYKTYAKIEETFRILTTNVDINGKPFVSTVEGRKYPFYGTQFHPEYTIFEWKHYKADHSKPAVVAMQYFANYFVEEARKNTHHFASDNAESSALIYNYNPTDDKVNQTQIYYF